MIASTLAATRRNTLNVVDLSSLWAGPLCGSLLAMAGADVVKVESATRPGAMRTGSPQFFDLLNGGKQHVALDLANPPGRRALHELIAGADVVIEASRPRALQQLGIDAYEFAATGTLWVSITGHGRDQGHRVAFGDDAAVAGGLVAWDEDGPVFCADAIADPLTGLVAATEVLDRLAIGQAGVLDISMAAVAASFASPTLPVPDGVEAAPPRARVAVVR